MPPVPAVRGGQVVGALEKAGFIVARINGSHYIMRHPDGRRTTVPVHAGRDIRPPLGADRSYKLDRGASQVRQGRQPVRW